MTDEPSDPPGAPAVVSSFLELSPASLRDAGKLLVWCFIAGYSERFVTGVLAQLEATPARKQ